MKLPRERFDYVPMPARKPLKLPNGARVAVWTIVNVEEWDIRGAMPRSVLPPPQGVTVIPDVPNFAWHEYGMRVGFWRLMAALNNAGMKATMALNANVCNTYPQITKAAMEAGWEFMGHGYVQGAMNLLKDEREAVKKAVETIKQFTGKPPKGWLSPGLTETWDTLDILAEEGIKYVSNWVADDQPFEIKTTKGSLVSVPYSVELNDIPMMVIQHHKAEELFLRTKDQFDRLYEEGGSNARVMAIAIHPFITGVPHRIKYLEQAYDYIRRHKDVWLCTGEEIYEWYRSAAR